MSGHLQRVATRVSLSFSVTDLAADVPVGRPDDHSVLGRVVLVLVLHNQALSGEEVRFTLCRVNKNQLLLLNHFSNIWINPRVLDMERNLDGACSVREVGEERTKSYLFFS